MDLFVVFIMRIINNIVIWCWSLISSNTYVSIKGMWCVKILRTLLKFFKKSSFSPIIKIFSNSGKNKKTLYSMRSNNLGLKMIQKFGLKPDKKEQTVRFSSPRTLWMGMKTFRVGSMPSEFDLLQSRCYKRSYDRRIPQYTYIFI